MSIWIRITFSIELCYGLSQKPTAPIEPEPTPGPADLDQLFEDADAGQSTPPVTVDVGPTHVSQMQVVSRKRMLV